MRRLVNVGIGLLVLGGWTTHLWICVSANAWTFLVAGGLVLPVAVLHGWSSWLGYPWV